MTDYRGVVRQIYAGHIHRDDFRVFPNRDGNPLVPVHVNPAVSPVYFNNPAVEIGWYDKRTGDFRSTTRRSIWTSPTPRQRGLPNIASRAPTDTRART